MPWYEYSAARGGRTRPVVEIRLWRDGREARIVGLVDSGADTSLFDAVHADVLGLERGNAQSEVKVGADGDPFTIFRWPDVRLEMGFEQRRFPFRGGFMDFPPAGEAVNVLGRDDFFQQFIVQFWDAAEMMNIDLSPDFPAPPVA